METNTFVIEILSIITDYSKRDNNCTKWSILSVCVSVCQVCQVCKCFDTFPVRFFLLLRGQVKWGSTFHLNSQLYMTTYYILPIIKVLFQYAN